MSDKEKGGSTVMSKTTGVYIALRSARMSSGSVKQRI